MDEKKLLKYSVDYLSKFDTSKKNLHNVLKRKILRLKNNSIEKKILFNSIESIINKLEKNNFKDIMIMSYSAKYASSFYGPFRDAVDSKKLTKPSHKKTYQMNINNSNEAIREASMDISEGADILMVKPGISYLDIIYRIKHELNFPTFAYQVSGEYSMIKESINKGWLNEKVIIESLLCFKRAGANGILTYFALEIAEKL